MLTAKELNNLCQEVSPLPMLEVLAVVAEPLWQQLRRNLKGKKTEIKLQMLSDHLEQSNRSRESVVQVVNYLNALKRGGQLDTECNIRIGKYR